MTVGAGISVSCGRLSVLGESILSDVHENIILTPADGGMLTNGAFIGVQSDQIGCRRIFPIGKLRDLRFMCVFRFKLWWMTHRMGSSGQDVPVETQFLIVEGRRDGSLSGEEQPGLYVVLLPILEGDFRAVLQGNPDDELEICLESVHSPRKGPHGFPATHSISEPMETDEFSAPLARAGVATWPNLDAAPWPGVPLGGGHWRNAAAIGPRGCGPWLSVIVGDIPFPGSVSLSGATAGGLSSDDWGSTEWNAAMSAALRPDWRNIEEIDDGRIDIGRSSASCRGASTRRRGGGCAQKPPAVPVASAPDTIDLTEPNSLPNQLLLHQWSYS